MNDDKDEMIENFDISDKNGNRIFFMSLSKIVLGDENQVLIFLRISKNIFRKYMAYQERSLTSART